MATKKTRANKSLKQLADSLPPAYELHRSGGEVVGEISEELRQKYAVVKEGESREAKIMADPAFPKGCVILNDHITIWKPHIYKAQINHYRRLRNAYSLKGEEGVMQYLADIKKAQLERKAKLEKEKEKVATTKEGARPTMKLKAEDMVGVEKSFEALSKGGGLQEYLDNNKPLTIEVKNTR